ncbi:TetR/AcrR family transcriptional regulator [Salipaludibacillus sp. HK11]|uniref:TetR/AcrR family transcriptional regulator n=1 Tax=Salipaludibacillus sp. HK11 TaxID=3394320 RepID=UPI0039FD22DA
MSRKKTIDQAQLFHETEQLVLKSGYAGFHFKALAERLGVARSTIYNYYKNKEELVTAYMIHLIEEVVKNMQQADQEEEPLKYLIHLWSRYAHMHQMLQIMPYIDQHATEKVQENINKMFRLFKEMKQKIEAILVDGQTKGEIRTDVQMTTLVGLVMATVQVPVRHMSQSQWVEEVYLLVVEGIKK